MTNGNIYINVELQADGSVKTNARAEGIKVAADAARKISEDVRDDGPCGREALTDVYIMLNEAANGGGE